MDVLAQRLHFAAFENESGIRIKICPRAEKIPYLLFC